MSNPLEKYLQEKTAAQTSFPGMGMGRMAELGRKAQSVAGNAAVGGLAAAAAGGMGVAASKIYDSITKAHDFRMMLENNEDLQAHQASNPKLFNLAYSSLRTTSPAFAKDPLISGHYMRRIFEEGNSPGGILMQAMNESPKHQAAGGMIDAFGKGALEGAKAGLGK